MTVIAPGHLLIVEDNRAIRKLLATHFKELRYQVTEADSAEQAKIILLEHLFKFDLVLSDISMPGESGFDLLRWIKTTADKPDDLPVLLMTGVLPDAASRVKGLALGAVDYVVRPDDETELVVRAVKAIDHYKRVRSLERSLEDTQDLAMVGRILAASNHEVKNIVTLVKLSADKAADILSGKVDAPESIKIRVAENLRMSTDLLIDVVRNFKSLMPEADISKTIDLKKLVGETLQLMSYRTKSCLVDWDCDAVAGLVIVSGQTTRIKQILINLILNGLEAITELDPVSGGHIVIRLTDMVSHWMLLVRDNGIGFEGPEKTEFKAFETTKKLKGGQGLGLWLCSLLARSMGGQLTLASEGVSSGAVACLMIPKAAADANDFEIDLEKYFVN